MYYLLDKKYDQTFSINFIGNERFEYGSTLKLTTPDCLKGLTKITSYSDNIIGENSTSYIKRTFRYKKCSDIEWSDTFPIEEITNIELCKTSGYLFELIYFRIDDGGPNNTLIYITSATINGEFEYTSSDSQLILTSGDTTQILELGDLLKIFKIDAFEVISSAKYGKTFNIKYRFSQDSKLSWSEWENLTTENISTVHWDKTRFVEIQYLFEMESGYKTPVKIYDVILYGDFQNVTANSKKINLYGLKENCVNLAFKPAEITEITSGVNDDPDYAKSVDSTTIQQLKETSEYQLRMNYITQGVNCYSNPYTTNGQSQIDIISSENNTNKSNFWNPYEFGKITDWYNMLATQISQMLGMTVDYHLTDPDGNGIDKVIHEQQLFNIVDVKSIKVLVPENQFPDNQIVINQFNLDLFDTFKINILKDDFKNAFGLGKRPSKEDIIYFCQINRMYIIKHAQIHKDVMNSGIYYDVILEKYEQRSNVINRSDESKNRIEELTRNTTIDELFGFEEKQEFDKIANKIQTKPKSFDFIRSIINARTVIVNESIMNGNIEIIENYYDIRNVAQTENAIEYSKADNILLKSDNRSFITWFKFPNDFDEGKAITKKTILGYDIDENKYYFIKNKDKNNIGYDIWYQSGFIYFMINDNIYKIDATDIMTNVWYAILINLNQRQNKIEIKILKRNTTVDVILFKLDTYERLQLNIENDAQDIEYEMSVNGFRAVDNIENESPEVKPLFIVIKSIIYDINPTEFENDINISIPGSKMYLTNIRIFNDIIKNEYIQNILNQLIIKDAQYLILADNGNKKLLTTNFPNKQWK
jgi:hypothetical protein